MLPDVVPLPKLPLSLSQVKCERFVNSSHHARMNIHFSPTASVFRAASAFLNEACCMIQEAEWF